jgi:ribosomal protein L40E
MIWRDKMVYCIKCGKKNDDEAQYCSKCGNSLSDAIKKENTIEKNIQNFADGIERAGIKAGEKIEKSVEKIGQETKDIGLKLEKAKDRVGSYLDNWWDRTFKIFGPLVSSFIVIIVLRAIIEGLRIGAEETPVMGLISNFLLDYLLLIFVFILISSYNSYFYRKYKKYQWFSPVITAFIFVFISWIIVNILSILGTSIGNLELINAEVVWREKYMLMIFVIVLLVGYLIKVATVAWEKDKKS